MDINTPIGGVFVDDREDFGSDLLTLTKEFVERSFARDPAHGGLSELEHGVVDILNLINSFAGVGYFVVDNRIHFAGHIVFGDGILLGDIDSFGADINFAERLKNGDY